ncbi:MAG TPA: transporter substrate-binding domain-containing protein, partial [Pseudonocardia sp.]|nr:transporter substrate-binding domain-containing protein [Pseudonocardia sp.]
SYDAIVEQIAPSSEPAVFNTNDDAKLALQNGQVDAIVVDLPTAFFITSAELENGVIVGQLPLGEGTPEQFGAVLDKDSPLTSCVSQAVDALREDGTLAQLEEQWLASSENAPELS